MRLFYIILLVFGAFLMPSFGFADEPALPAECPGAIEDYNIVDVASSGFEFSTGNDFIFAGDGNSALIDGGNGNDCILIDDSNTAAVSGANEDDVIILGDNNSGAISSDGENGDDIIKAGDNNSGNIFGGNGADTIIIGKNNSGDIFGENGDDDITVDCGNIGSVDDDFKKIPCLPVADPLPGTYTQVQNISLTSEDSASIYYTIDETDPDCSSELGTLYESPISIFSTLTIMTVGCSEDDLASEVATFTYTIEKLEAISTDLSSLLEAKVFVPKDGTAAAATTEINVAQKIEIKATSTSESSVILEKDLVISRVDDGEFDANLLTSSEVEVGSLTGLTSGSVVKGALQWGIPGTGLKFSEPITVSIFVGIDLNGQTLNVVRSVTGNGDWTSDGIVPPATCVVSDGICAFQATKASFYASYVETPSAPQTNNSSGGSAWGSGVGIGEYINGPLAEKKIVEDPIETTPTSSVSPVPDSTSTSAVSSVPNGSPQATPTPTIETAVKPIKKIAHVVRPIEQGLDSEVKTASIVETVQVPKSKSFVVSLFVSIGRLIFRSLPFF